ncbi:uncharacterized protein DFL_001205 [Arthrobotrys flagrans]|uniref:Uncharacterized protein n=1 Tax=Arthrobotrys flagrans TaxID=97331 RepID=A0A437AGJ8_ARTFL|nr:hypothetical protein DFL_001205 [Arthrobotrys flagrans]
MPSFLQRIGLKKRKPGKNKLGKTADLPTSAVTRDAESIPAVLAPRRSFDSRASGSIISIPRSVEDFEDFKPWKKKKNKGKQAHRGNADITEQMRRDFIALQHKIDRIEAHVVPKTPPDAFNLDDLNTAVTTNAIRTFVECAMVVYEEGKDPDVLTDSVPETPDDIRNAFVKALERCNDPEFLFRLSQKILQKYSTTYGPKTTDAGPSEQQDLRSDGASEPSSKPMQTILLPQIEYRPRRRHENEVCLSVSRPYRLSPILQQFIPASELKSKPDLIRGELRRIDASPPNTIRTFSSPIDQVSNRASQEPKYLGLHDLYAENCIERLENQASEMANLPRTYTENVAVERIGSRPQIEATVSRPNTLTKPDEPCFKSSPEDLSIDDETLDLEILPISRASLTSSLGPLPQKTPHDSRVPLSFTDNPIVLPMSFPDPSFDEVLSEDEEESDVDLGCSIRYDGQNPQQASPLTISEPQLEPGPEEQGMQVLDTDRIRIGGDPCCVSVSSECGFCVDNDQADDGEEEDDRNWDDEAAAHLRAIHLLILLKVLAKRQNESQGSIQTNQSSSSSSRSPTPSDSSEASGSGSNSSTTSQSISVSDSNGTKPGGSSKKRPRENDPNENGNNPNGPPQKKLAIDMIRDTLKRFACPFARGKPNEHSGCQMINRQNLSGLKLVSLFLAQ